MTTDEKLDQILARLAALEEQGRDLKQKMRVLGLEQRTGFAELKGSIADLRITNAERHDALKSRLDTLIDSLADFRREYAEHTHPE